MPWPLSQDYNEAVQSPESSFADPELRRGEVATNALGLPMPCSGNFADVYRFNCPASHRSWAVKCFTRQIPGLQERYQQISSHLHQGKPPFIVDFTFLDRGIQVRGDWYPIVKMQWVEGPTLNQFVKSNLDKPQVLDMLCQLWVKLATRLREANIAHCDLQHGNVLLVPGSKGGSAAVRLVDYDGMCVPALTLLKSIEVGHPAYQHPQRLREGIYSLEVDRFSHLVIYTALRSLMVGGRPLWERHDDGDNLLFCQADFQAPGRSRLLGELSQARDPEVRRLAQVLILAAEQPLAQTPLLDQVVSPSSAKTAPATGPASAPPKAGNPVQPGMVFTTATPGNGALAPRKPASHTPRTNSFRATRMVLAVSGLALVVGGVLFAFHTRSTPWTDPALAQRQTSEPARAGRPTAREMPGTKRKPDTTVQPEKMATGPEVRPNPGSDPQIGVTNEKPVRDDMKRKPSAALLVQLTPEEERKVDQLLRHGIDYLRQTQQPNGSWAEDRTFLLGYTALAALTLLECGVPASDPSVQTAADFVRKGCPTLKGTYELSLGLLFLDRLRDGADEGRIQQLALRLMAGQLAGGWWSYNCPVLDDADHEQLLALLRDRNTTDPDAMKRPPSAPRGAVPARLAGLALVHDDLSQDGAFYRKGNGDNSNTQFAMLALWTARRHGLPVDRCLARVVRRFRATQNEDGSWNYGSALGPVNSQGNPTMTCAGLLGLALGHGLAAGSRKAGIRPWEDASIERAIQVLAMKVGSRPAATPDLYFLVGVERVAVLYQLKTIGDKDWYRWGMDLLFRGQEPDGGWPRGGGPGMGRTINTCFAMLFLKRVNLATDLTDKITAIRSKHNSKE